MATPLYVRLADVLEEMIQRRALRPGDKIPSLREFSASQRVSVPTALSAYAALEARGLVEARPKSGFYVAARQADAIPGILPSKPAPKVSDLAHSDPLELLTADRNHPSKVQFGTAVPDIDLLPGARLTRILSGIARRLGPSVVAYDEPLGPLALRRAIVRRALLAGIHLASPDEVLITAGATEAISLALRATCSPGDTVVVESPTYFGLLRQLREHGLKALPIPVDPLQGINLDALATALARNRVAALLLIPNFQNPVGSLMPEPNQRELVRLATAKGVPIIEDDVYGDLQHHGARPHTLKTHDLDGSILHLGSFSKTIAPGYRVGYVIGGKWQHRLQAIKKTHTGTNPALPSLAVAEFLQNGGYDRYIRSLREACRVQMDTMRDAICQQFPDGIRLSRPEGGFILWCELPRNVDSLELFHRARAAGVTIAPGPLFSTDGGFRNFIRLNAGLRWSPRVANAVATVGQIAKQLTG